MKERVIAVFDIGKTNKKILLFDKNLKVVFQKEEKFPTVTDEDGFECDDIDLIEKWIINTLSDLLNGNKYDVTAVNYSTYGASLMFLDEVGKRLTPVYNYLKPIPENIAESLFAEYGGKDEFCRKTASPALGVMLNSGIQILWLKKERGEVYTKAKNIIHFPQYLSYLISGEITSELTSIGCHTYLWDFDQMKYHQWLKKEQIKLPNPVSNSTLFDSSIEGLSIKTGIGIHDSSASLVPYIRGSKENFVLISTGTWCITMNPFNYTPLTAEELSQDCLCYLSISQKPVKSARLFMGHIHDVNVKRLEVFFGVDKGSYKKVTPSEVLLGKYLKNGINEPVFFKNGIPKNYIDSDVDLDHFANFEEAYQRFVYDLTIQNVKSINLVLDESDGVKTIYVSGGFARNEIYVRLLANFFPDKKVYTSEVDNSSALGAALVVWDEMEKEASPEIDLGLVPWKVFTK